MDTWRQHSAVHTLKGAEGKMKKHFICYLLGGLKTGNFVKEKGQCFC